MGILFAQARERGANAVALGQPGGYPRILGDDEAHLVQYAEGTEGDIIQVADGGRYDEQRSPL